MTTRRSATDRSARLASAGQHFNLSRRKNRRRVARGRSLAVETLEGRMMLSGSTGLLPSEFAACAIDMGGSRQIEVHSVHGHGREIDDPLPLDQFAAGNSAMNVSSQPISASFNPLSSIPALHSLAGAAATLFLDFDGNFAPVWGAWTSVATPVYDVDGDLTTFSDTELLNIEAIWARVAEDFAPFNIDVTTVEPPVLAEGVPIEQANGVALRVAIGGSWSDWYGNSAGGLGHINAFTNTRANLVFVFTATSTTSPLWVGKVASHEAGHGFGLHHQSLYDANGVLLEEYHPGNGTWLPIMGNGVYHTDPTTTWHNGPNPFGSTSFQDDMSILAGSLNGFGYRPDDVGNSIATAAPLTFDGLAYHGAGIIGTNTDLDVWSFDVTAEDTYRISVDPAAVDPNLDSVLEIRNSAGSLIAAASPAAILAAELVMPLSAGSYFLTVAKTAAYGFLGAYSVSIAAPSGGISVSAADPIVTREGGAMVNFTVVLDTQPTADVTIPISSSNLGEGTVSAASLVFTPANWNVPQIVGVAGAADGVLDGDADYTVVIGLIISEDVEYAGLDVNDLAAVNLDNTASGYLYWVDHGNDLIQRSTLHGTNVQTIVDLKALFGGIGTDYTPRGLTVDTQGGKVYWGDAAAKRIQRANLDGTNVETLVTGLGDLLRGLAIDAAAGKMYWTDAGAQKIQRANLNGTSVETLVTGGLSGAGEISLDVAAGKMYWTDLTANNIRRANLNGTNIEVVWSAPEPSSPAGITLDIPAGKMYWTDSGNDVIRRANLDGTNVEQLVDTGALIAPDSTPVGIVIDHRFGKIYWTDNKTAAVHRANLDGTNISSVVTGLSLPQGLDIVFPAVTVTPTAGLVTSESGGTANFKVGLATAPNANVTINVQSSDLTEGTVLATNVTFTPANWNVAQTINVTGVNDTIIDGSIAYTIVLSAASSGDSAYNGLNPADVSVSNTDNDVPPTKFYVVDDGTANRTYEYQASGTAVENYTLNSGNSAPRGAASNVAGDRVWVVDANRNVYVYNTSGGLLGSWTAGTMASNATPEGIATNGTDVWIVDSRSDKVFRYTGAATCLSGSQNAASSFNLNSGNADAKDIVTNGSSLWVVNDASTDKVFKYSTSGSLQGSWTISSANSKPTGITIDPTNVSNIWIVDSGTDRVYQYTGAASRTSGSQAAAASFALAAGNTNPQGIADPPALGAAMAAAPMAVEMTQVVGTSTFAHDGFGVHRRQDALKYSRVTVMQPNSSRPGLIRSDLLFARALVFDAVHQERCNVRADGPLRLAMEGDDKSNFAERTEEHDAMLDDAIDALFVGAM